MTSTTFLGRAFEGLRQPSTTIDQLKAHLGSPPRPPSKENSKETDSDQIQIRSDQIQIRESDQIQIRESESENQSVSVSVLSEWWQSVRISEAVSESSASSVYVQCSVSLWSEFLNQCQNRQHRQYLSQYCATVTGNRWFAPTRSTLKGRRIFLYSRKTEHILKLF